MRTCFKYKIKKKKKKETMEENMKWPHTAGLAFQVFGISKIKIDLKKKKYVTFSLFQKEISTVFTTLE